MRSSHAPASLLLLASLLAPVCAAQTPAKNLSLRQIVVEVEALLVTVDAKRKVFVGLEQVGTTDDVGPLRERVRQAIERRRQAAREKGDEAAAEAANTVFICAPPDMKYGEVVRVVDAIKEAGGDPVGLQTDCKPPRKERPPARAHSNSFGSTTVAAFLVEPFADFC